MGMGPQEQEQKPQSDTAHEAEPTGETIPDSKNGVGMGASEDANTFEPEEDPEAAADEE